MLKDLRNISSWVVWAVALTLYCVTLDPGVSYWDCPEYVTCASRLEVGHPPGNPVWMLAMRVVTMPFPLHMHALAVNVASAVLMAFAAFFLCRIIFDFTLWVGLKTGRGKTPKRHDINRIAALSSLGGALCFAVCDSVWFSAVEAEVYAFSTFLTALSIWLMVRWAVTRDRGRQTRLLVLLAYVMGLSLGVHQLNLLCIPALALIYVFRTRWQPGQTRRAWLAVLVSFVIIALVLMVMMPWTLKFAGKFELFATRTLGLPLHSGVLIYLALLLAAFLLAVRFIRQRVILTVVWMAGMLLLGYSSFALILIRGAAAPPMNEGAPTDIFSLADYIGRDQYGSRPLAYGATPFSKPLLAEDSVDGRPVYRRYILKRRDPVMVPLLPGARLHHRSGLVTAADSGINQSVLKAGGGGYLLADYKFERVMTPELDMWLPRITGSTPFLLKAYGDWAGMDTATMTRVEVSETLDAHGNPAGRLRADGKRHKGVSWRPTYMQNLKMLTAYQLGYMYFRYLMWNFVGRQNDIPSTGEIDHGNFITGIDALDTLMVGDRSLMPPSASRDNPGRNVYYGIPFIFGVWGIVFLCRSGRRGRRVCAVVAMLFVMTGVAIAFYLNQTPGEPRERDYSFLGSFMAFGIWIAFGFAALARAVIACTRSGLLRTVLIVVPALGLPAWMAAVNFDDHDRRGRDETAAFAENVLNSVEPGIIFTQGDNFTFPLWYAAEVGNAWPGGCVIDINYLATPGYVVNLMRQGADIIRFTATPGDVAYGAYTHTRVAAGADTTAIPLGDALRELYAQREGRPEFGHSRVVMPDSTVIDLRAIAGGGGIPFRQLMMLDILASNPDKGIYFMNHLLGNFLSPILRSLSPRLFVQEYNDTIQEKITRYMALKSPAPVYADPVVTDQHRRQRGALIQSATRLMGRGRYDDAAKTGALAVEKHPYGRYPAGSFTVADTTYHEGLEFVRLQLGLARALNDSSRLDYPRTLLGAMHDEALAWKRYYVSLPPWRRGAVSDASRRLILTLPAIDSLANEISNFKPDHETQLSETAEMGVAGPGAGVQP